MGRLIDTDRVIHGKGSTPGLENILAISNEFPFALRATRTQPPWNTFANILDELVAGLLTRGPAIPANPEIAYAAAWEAEEAVLTRFWLIARDPDPRPGSWVLLARPFAKLHDLTAQFGEDWRTPLDLMEKTLAELALNQDRNPVRRVTKIRHRIKSLELP